jgi:class 3 adenylate cyclase
MSGAPTLLLGRLSAGGRLKPQRVRGGDMAQLPTGTVTFLFTDIEGSTLLRNIDER